MKNTQTYYQSTEIARIGDTIANGKNGHCVITAFSGDGEALTCNCYTGEKIPALVSDCDLISRPTQPEINEYNTQATQFLDSNGLKLRATLSDTKTPAWGKGGKHGHHYRVTLSRPKAKTHRLHSNDGDGQGYQLVHIVGRVPSTGAEIVRNGSSRYTSLETLQQVEKWSSVPRLTFDFWGSSAEAESGKAPTPYDILTCISSEAYPPETFEDWCAEYGDNSDSLNALQTFRRCNAFANRLRAFFTPAELSQLSEIR